jgi:hypothetical protein
MEKDTYYYSSGYIDGCHRLILELNMTHMYYYNVKCYESKEQVSKIAKQLNTEKKIPPSIKDWTFLCSSIVTNS